MPFFAEHIREKAMSHLCRDKLGRWANVLSQILSCLLLAHSSYLDQIQLATSYNNVYIYLEHIRWDCRGDSSVLVLSLFPDSTELPPVVP